MFEKIIDNSNNMRYYNTCKAQDAEERNMSKYEVKKIGKDVRFYTLKNENGKTLASIEYSGWGFYKYNVSFAYDTVKDNLEKARKFMTLREAKEYVAEVVNND